MRGGGGRGLSCRDRGAEEQRGDSAVLQTALSRYTTQLMIPFSRRQSDLNSRSSRRSVKLPGAVASSHSPNRQPQTKRNDNHRKRVFKSDAGLHPDVTVIQNYCYSSIPLLLVLRVSGAHLSSARDYHQRWKIS